MIFLILLICCSQDLLKGKKIDRYKRSERAEKEALEIKIAKKEIEDKIFGKFSFFKYLPTEQMPSQKKETPEITDAYVDEIMQKFFHSNEYTIAIHNNPKKDYNKILSLEELTRIEDEDKIVITLHDFLKKDKILKDKILNWIESSDHKLFDDKGRLNISYLNLIFSFHFHFDLDINKTINKVLTKLNNDQISLLLEYLFLNTFDYDNSETEIFVYFTSSIYTAGYVLMNINNFDLNSILSKYLHYLEEFKKRILFSSQVFYLSELNKIKKIIESQASVKEIWDEIRFCMSSDADNPYDILFEYMEKLAYIHLLSDSDINSRLAKLSCKKISDLDSFLKEPRERNLLLMNVTDEALEAKKEIVNNYILMLNKRYKKMIEECEILKRKIESDESQLNKEEVVSGLFNGHEVSLEEYLELFFLDGFNMKKEHFKLLLKYTTKDFKKMLYDQNKSKFLNSNQNDKEEHFEILRKTTLRIS